MSTRPFIEGGAGVVVIVNLVDVFRIHMLYLLLPKFICQRFIHIHP